MRRSPERDIVDWIQEGRSRTLGEIAQTFPGKGHAIVIMILMLLPATPLPTGAVTHVFELIACILAIQIILGVRALWLPRRFKAISISGEMLMRSSKTLVFLRDLESRLKVARVQVSSPIAQRVIGVAILICVASAFLAPPFSGLDTLPSLGAVLLSLSLIVESLTFAVMGVIVGGVGLGLEVTVGKFVYKQLLRVFN